MERLTDKVAIVTGASSGIGKALTELMVCNGMKVIGIARRIDRMKTLAEELKTQPGKLFPLQCDLGNQSDIMQVMQWIEKNIGCVDILVNNAAVNLEGNCLTGGMDEWKKTFDVNVIGLMCITKEVFKLMKKKGMDNGCIINVVDTCGWKVPANLDRPVSAAYTASKFALNALTSHLRAELAQLESNIKVICICPGLVETEMTQRWLKENPRQVLQPKNVAESILFTLQTPDDVLIKDLVITPMRDIF